MDKIDKFEGEYRFLSNFYIADVEFEGIIYKSSEHAFQAAKTLEPVQRDKIGNTKNPGEARKLGKSKKISLRKNWDEIKTFVMFQIVYNKFTRHLDLAQKLMDTYPAELIEGNTWHDVWFGVCNGYGKNVLGHVLMLVRGLLMLQRATGSLPPVDFDKHFLNIRKEQDGEKD